MKRATGLEHLAVPDWEPVFYEHTGEELTPVPRSISNPDASLRAEQWLVSTDAYVYVERKSVDDEWSDPVLEATGIPEGEVLPDPHVLLELLKKAYGHRMHKVRLHPKLAELL